MTEIIQYSAIKDVPDPSGEGIMISKGDLFYSIEGAKHPLILGEYFSLPPRVIEPILKRCSIVSATDAKAKSPWLFEKYDLDWMLLFDGRPAITHSLHFNEYNNVFSIVKVGATYSEEREGAVVFSTNSKEYARGFADAIAAMTMKSGDRLKFEGVKEAYLSLKDVARIKFKDGD